MKKTDRNALVAFPILILMGLGVAWAGSQGGSSLVGIPLFALSVGLASSFAMGWPDARQCRSYYRRHTQACKD